MSSLGASDTHQQILVRREPSFANLAASINGKPSSIGLHTPGSAPAGGVTMANPSFESAYEVAENNEVSNRPFKSKRVLLTQSADVTCDHYVRGNGLDDSEVFTDNIFTLLSSVFGIDVTHAVEHDCKTFVDANTILVTGAIAAGLKVGMGFSVILPTGKTFVAFAHTITAGADDIVIFDPPMLAGELAACQAEAEDSIKMRGGRTYAVGHKYPANPTLYFALLKQAYVMEVFGCAGATFNADLQSGEAGMISLGWRGSHAHRGGYVATKAVTSWTGVDTCAVVDTTGLIAGMYAQVTTTIAPAGTYLVRIREIDGLDVTLEPTGLPAGITGEGSPPSLSAFEPGSTTEPNGSWLTMLNGRVWVDGEYRDTTSIKFAVDLKPSLVVTAGNLVGSCAVAMSAPEITCDVQFSYYDDGQQERNFEAGTQFGVIAVLGDGTIGNAAAFYSPAMQHRSDPKTGENDGLTALGLELEAGLYEGDTGSYDGVTLTDSLFRYFVAW